MTVYLFHYTDASSLDDILKQGYIRRTPQGDRHAHYGCAVYLTTLGPRTDRARLIFNNYRISNASSRKCPNLWAKTSAYIRIPMDDLPKVEKVYDPDHRIIYVNKQTIHLDRVEYKTGLIYDDDDEDDDDDSDEYDYYSY